MTVDLADKVRALADELEADASEPRSPAMPDLDHAADQMRRVAAGRLRALLTEETQ